MVHGAQLRFDADNGLAEGLHLVAGDLFLYLVLEVAHLALQASDQALHTLHNVHALPDTSLHAVDLRLQAHHNIVQLVNRGNICLGLYRLVQARELTLQARHQLLQLLHVVRADLLVHVLFHGGQLCLQVRHGLLHALELVRTNLLRHRLLHGRQLTLHAHGQTLELSDLPCADLLLHALLQDDDLRLCCRQGSTDMLQLARAGAILNRLLHVRQLQLNAGHIAPDVLDVAHGRLLFDRLLSLSDHGLHPQDDRLELLQLFQFHLSAHRALGFREPSGEAGDRALQLPRAVVASLQALFDRGKFGLQVADHLVDKLQARQVRLNEKSLLQG
mmetsp:Transcript_25067/g.63743  ORF Transcript_25067/g.63743 Transcript_25067/m.63743 type:complete len:331 (-) Transcript_25067:844-1836(-)